MSASQQEVACEWEGNRRSADTTTVWHIHIRAQSTAFEVMEMSNPPAYTAE